MTFQQGFDIRLPVFALLASVAFGFPWLHGCGDDGKASVDGGNVRDGTPDSHHQADSGIDGGSDASADGGEPCTPDCTDRCGGPNGCGGTCPQTCTGGFVCRPPGYDYCAPDGSVEVLGRGLVAVSTGSGNDAIYVGWRWLPWDVTEGVEGFNVYRATSPNGPFSKRNTSPITGSTNYMDTGTAGTTYYYMARPVVGGVEGSDSNLSEVTAGSADHISIPLGARSDGADEIAEILPADLNGDGVMDFVLEMGNRDDCPGGINTESVVGYLEALVSTPEGSWEPAWRINTGFADIYCQHGNGNLTGWDLTGDGRAEVVSWHGTAGHLAVYDGVDGSLLAEAPITGSLDGGGLNTIAMLEDVTGDGVSDPFIVVNSNGYGPNQALYTAHRLENGALVEDRRIDGATLVWTDDDGAYPQLRGFGTHGLVAVDLDGDGHDEVFAGGALLYPSWDGYWAINKGHLDVVYPGDINTSSAGPEVFMANELSISSITSQPVWATLVRVQGGVPDLVWVEQNVGCGGHCCPALHPSGWSWCDDNTINVNCPCNNGWICQTSGSPSACNGYCRHPDWESCGFDKGYCADVAVAGFDGMLCVSLEQDPTYHADPGLGFSRVFTPTGQDITNAYPWPHRMWMKWPVDWDRGDQTGKLLYSPTAGYRQGDCGQAGHTVVADVVGDSREEYVNYCRSTNTLRIFTNVSVRDAKHVTPLADSGYRRGVSRQCGYPANRILMKTNQPRVDIIPDAVEPFGSCEGMPAGHVCRPAAGACDVEEVCDGTNPDCPEDSFAPTTTECRPSTDACDPAEACDGLSAACPQDVNNCTTCVPGACASTNGVANASAGQVFVDASCNQGPPTAAVHCDTSPSCSANACSGTVFYHACDGAGGCRTDTTGAASETIHAAACTVFDGSCNPVTAQLGHYCHHTAEWMGTFCRLHWYGCAGDGTCDQTTPCGHHDTTSVTEANCN
jgi:hypothetical protein